MTEEQLKQAILQAERARASVERFATRQSMYVTMRALLGDVFSSGQDPTKTRESQKTQSSQYDSTSKIVDAIIDELGNGVYIFALKKTVGVDNTVLTISFPTNVGATTSSSQVEQGIDTPLAWVAQAYPQLSVVTRNGSTWFANESTLAADVPGTSSKWVVHELIPTPKIVNFKLAGGPPVVGDQIRLVIGANTYTYTATANDTTLNDFASGVAKLAAADPLFTITNKTAAVKDYAASVANSVWQTALSAMGILVWQPQAYPANSVVLYNSQIWTNTLVTLATDVPGVSVKWVLTSYGAAGGDLTGSYPNPTLALISTAATKGTAAKTVTATIDAKGRVTSLSDQDIQITESQVTNLTTDLDAKIPKSLATSADQGLYSTAASTWSVFSLTSMWRTFLSTVKAAWNETTGVFSTWGLQINTAPAVVPTGAPGLIVWNDTTGTLEFQLKGGNVTLEIGQEQILRVKNDEGSALAVGDVVYLSGADGNHVLVKKAAATNDALSAYTIGLVVEAMNNNGQGWVAISGYVRDLNTDHLTEGAPVWLSATLGLTTSTKPTPPNHSVFLGICVRKNANVGSILLAVQNGYEIDELHDVLVSNVAAGDLLVRNAGNTLWENKAQSTLSLTSSQVGLGNVTNVAQLPLSYLDTDGTLAANSDTKVPSQKAVKTYVDTAVTGLLDFKGSTDCSGNPNYPAASKGDAYIVSVAGKIGGAAGVSVDIGDVYLATADNAGGTQAAVGASWAVLEHNLVGALLAANNLSDLTNTTTARANLGLGNVDNVQQLPLSYLDTDGALTANSDTKVASQKATKTYADTKVSKSGDTMTGNLLVSGAKIGVGTASPGVGIHVAGTTTTDIIRSDIGYDVNPVLAPTTLSGVVLAVAGNVDIGNHRYFVTFVTALGETQFYFGPGNVGVSLTTSAGNQQVRLTIPVSSDYRVTSRRVYRSKVGGNYWDAYLVATIADNVTTTYDDNIADSALGATTQFFRENTTAKYFTQNGIGFLLASNQNTAFGVDTLSNIYNNTILGAENTVFGNSAGKSITSGTKNVIIGHKTGQSVSTAADTILIGHSAAFNGNPSTSIFMGRNVGYASTASGNVFVGNYSGTNNTTGGNNTYLGNNTGTATTTGGNNTCIGVHAGNNLNTGSYNIIIGNWILSPAANSVGILNIGNTIFGTGMFSGWPPSATPTNGSIAIGIQTPLARLHLPGGTATASTAPLKFTSGTLMTSPEAGAIEYDGTNLYYTASTTRETLNNKVSKAGDTMTGPLTISLPGDANTFRQVSGNGHVLIGTATDITAYGGAKLQVRESGSSVSDWKGRIVCGGDNAVFLMGEYLSNAWLGAHNSALTAWANMYIQPSISANIWTYIGTYGVWNNNIIRVKNLVGVGVGIDPTAYLHLKAGTATANTAPLKFTSGTLMTTPEAGAVEFLTDKAYLTITTGAARKELTLNDTALTSGQAPSITTNGRLTNSNKYDIYATSTTNGTANSAVNLTIATLPNNGDLRFVRITVKAKSAAAPPDVFGRTLDAMWGNAMGTLSQVGADSLGTAITMGNLASATIATSASGTTLRVTCTDVTGCGATVTWEVFGEYY